MCFHPNSSLAGCRVIQQLAHGGQSEWRGSSSACQFSSTHFWRWNQRWRCGVERVRGNSRDDVPIHGLCCAEYRGQHCFASQCQFSLTFDPATSSITISNIVVQNLQSNLTAVHIHGPCAGSVPCNTDVVYVICGSGGTPCPFATTATVNMSTVTGPSTFGLYQSILSGVNLYYVNIHSIT